MTAERASIFSEDELDLSEFGPASGGLKRPDIGAIRDAAIERGFISREAETASPDPNAKENSPPVRRRYTTGRNRQLNIKVTDEALKRFYTLADANGWVLGETFEHAVGALEQALKAVGD